LGDCLIDGEVNRGNWKNSAKFEMVHNWWDALCGFEESATLKDATKGHLYKSSWK